MALQTTYAQSIPPGAPGMLADSENFNAFSRTATATIVFGAPAQRNGDHSCSPLVSGGEFLGIARRSVVINPANAGDQYVQYDSVPLVDEGVIWGVADAAITVGAALNWNTATLRYTTAAASGTVIAVPGAEADQAASGAAALFKIRLRRPVS